ncbi:MAG: NAD kinase [Alphaproteobacteria bacterium]|nr:NAD kinase [Alphaproteobacteria bacterium]
MQRPKITFFASKSIEAQRALHALEKSYISVPLEEADMIIALGGDGYLLRVLHQVYSLKKPVFGMNCGSVGFLMNPYDPHHLLERLEKATAVTLPTLVMEATDLHDKVHTLHAINEVSLFRKSALAGHLKVSVDGHCHLEELVCDGILLSTPAGSTAYNLSIHGPILPLESRALALTPISAFRPRRWKGAILSDQSVVTIDILSPQERPLSAVADYQELPLITHVKIYKDPHHSLTLLFDPDRALEKRIMKEQFLV